VEYLVLMFECVIESGHLEPVDGESADLQYFDTSSIPKLAIPYPKEIFNITTSERTFFQ
jgi:hypothetical protein